MAGNTGFLSTSELDFSAVKSNLITYLKNQSQFADYNFEASNFNVLLDILAYNTYLNSFYLNQVGSEMFLDTTQLKESAVSHSKELNYLPRSRTSAMALVDVTVTPSNGLTPPYITIPKYYKFTTQVNGGTHNFTVPDDIIIRPVDGAYTAANTAIYEGTIVTEYFNVAGNNTTYTLQSDNIDTRSMSVYVYESSTSSIYYPYIEATSLFGITPTSNVFFMQGYGQNKYQISFGNDVTGRKLTQGNVVRVEYRDTLGETMNGAFLFKSTSPFYDENAVAHTNISVALLSAATDGSERESIDSIKFNAPRYFPTQERTVTSQDYIALTKAKFPQLQSVIAYGGEELIPPQYGRVAISVKPFGTSGLISDSLKINIVNYLKLKNLTTEPIIVNPEFFYVKIDSILHYDSRLTSKSSAQIRSLAEVAILNYATLNLSEFGSDLRYSKLINAIDSSETSIVSNETKLKIIKRWTPVSSIQTTLVFSYENELYHEAVLYSLPQGHEHALQSSSFIYTHTDNVDYTCYIADDGLGTLNIYTIQILAGNSVRKVLNPDIGIVNYITGEITLTAKIKSYTGNHISIYGILKNKDIYAQKNKFILIESTDINLSITDITK